VLGSLLPCRRNGSLGGTPPFDPGKPKGEVQALGNRTGECMCRAGLPAGAPGARPLWSGSVNLGLFLCAQLTRRVGFSPQLATRRTAYDARPEAIAATGRA
jgi:hypothetical protein